MARRGSTKIGRCARKCKGRKRTSFGSCIRYCMKTGKAQPRARRRRR